MMPTGMSDKPAERERISSESSQGTIYEAQRQDLNTTNPRGNSNVGTDGVDIEAAEHEFHEISRKLTEISRVASHQSRRSVSVHSVKVTDPEKGGADAESDVESFDLETHLHGSQTDEMAVGIKPKHIGVVWEDLTVSGIGGDKKTYVKTFPEIVFDFFNIPGTIWQIFGMHNRGREVDILKNFRGVAKPGEMVLVLGRPGSGCTSFLKVIANQRKGYTKVDGNVSYGRFSAEEFEKKYRGESVYNEEDDVHHPTLTVGQTLGFALDTKTPGKRPAGMSKAQFKDNIINMLLKMFNITHTKDTIVGNAFVRGVSGGERKRVSIAEMMITKATLCCWDNSSRGLDASTALDYVKSLRIMTNIYKTTTFVSLYQASENIYNLFDKVLVIDDGNEVFFGPTNEARKYFESLGFAEKPRQTTPDYLTGCTDEFEREFAPGRHEDNVPCSSEALEEAFRNSAHWTNLNSEMESYRQEVRDDEEVHKDFITATTEQKRRAVPKSSVYTVPFTQQIWALMYRQFLLKWQDKFGLTVSWLTSIILAIVMGTVYLKMPVTSGGAFTRGGMIFMALLFNAFQAFSELASTMMGRGIVNKHRAYTFYRPAALWIAQILVDVVFAAAQILLFSIITYFMCNLVLDAGAFFTFWLMILCGYLCMTLFFRSIGCICPDFDYAVKFTSVIITLFVLTSGYLIPMHTQADWVSWVFYVNPLGLAFSAMMMNEFKHLTLECGPESLIPQGPEYAGNGLQTCTLLGSIPGSTEIDGKSYINQTFSYDPAHLWRNFGILVALIIGFLIANATLGELVVFGAGGKTVTVFAKEDKKLKELNRALAAKKDLRRKNKGKADNLEQDNLKIDSTSVLTWEDLVYEVPVPGGTRKLLNNIYGYVKPGQLTALMGASGAGKTTLLDVLASRKNIGVITGDVLIDGMPKGTSFQRGTAYAEQQDTHEPTQTVREALRFSAYLRQPYHVSQAEKDAYVEEVIGLLEMENIADAIIGSPIDGLDVESRKRVTIGVELAAKPQLLLFLDEPTSGLDSQSAYNIVRFLKKLAGAGQAILCTIHQPNANLFEFFDRLLLLQRGGQCVYFGDIGDDAETLLDYFKRNGGGVPPHNANPAEWMLDAIGTGSSKRAGDRDWGDIWRGSPELANVKAEIQQIKSSRQSSIGSAPPSAEDEAEYATPVMYQLKQVMHRTNLSFWRTPNYGFSRLFMHVAVALFSGLVFFNLDTSRQSMQYRVFLLFQVTVLPALILAQVEPRYDFGRTIFYREQSSKMYNQFVFAATMVIAEVPYSILCATAFYVCIYFPAGMKIEATRSGYQFLMILVAEIFSVTLGQLLAAITPNFFVASLLNPPINIVFALFCGVTIPQPNLNVFWKYWMYELDPMTRLISGMVVTELHDLPVVCEPNEFNKFTVPDGMTCGEYASSWLDKAAGYVADLNATGTCDYCAFKKGDEFYGQLGLSYDNRWRDLGILIAFCGSNLCLLYLASKYMNFGRR